MDMLINTNDLFDNHIYLLVHRHDLLSEFLDIQMNMAINTDITSCLGRLDGHVITNDLFNNLIYLLVDRHDLLSEFLDIQVNMLINTDITSCLGRIDGHVNKHK